MNAPKIIETLKRIPIEAQSAYIQTQLNDWKEGVVEILNHIIDRLTFLNDNTLEEYKELRRFIELIITHLPDDYAQKPEGLRKALVKPISATIFIEEYPQKFVSIRKLISIDLRDPRSTCKLLCRAIDRAVNISDWEYEALLPHFHSMVINDVDEVLHFIEDLFQSFQNNGAVEEFIRRMESDLKVIGLRSVKGPSLRKQYARELVGSGVIDTKTPILIVGASGTSKTFLAQRIAQNSEFNNLALVNSAGDARQDLKIALTAASMSPTTILLDEVYALPASLQKFCLAEFGRVGIEMRIISTSSTPVEVLQETLVPDFFYRINGWLVRLKPLAASRPDVEEAIRALVEERHRMGIDDRVVRHLRDQHTWPDNFRGVERVMEALCRKCKSKGVDVISVEILAELKPEIDEDILKILRPLI
jgi:transcriptional regulator of acetoin/glycerol metabolism